MRRLFIALIIVMFVGGHGFSSGIGMSSNNPIAGSHLNTSSDQVIVTMVNQAMADLDGGKCCLQRLESSALDTTGGFSGGSSSGFSGSSHCTAHCGIGVGQFVAKHPNASWNLGIVLEIANLAKSSNEHFRPPIA